MAALKGVLWTLGFLPCFLAADIQGGVPPPPPLQPVQARWRGISSPVERFAVERLEYFEPRLVHSPGVTTAVFIHACVGIFKKKRPPGTNETWGYGREIMEELLEHVQSSGLLSRPDTSVYVTLLGSIPDRALARRTMQRFNESGNVLVLLQGTNLYVSELPTMKAIQMYSQRVAGRSRILYFHTKGMRNSGKYASDWRRYAQFFLVTKHSLCLQALELGHATCGVQLSGEEYVGNFWWARAEWLARREMNLLLIAWNMNNRFAAEDFLLSPTVLGSNEVQQHYCLLFIHHNLYDCPTPPSLYETLPITPPRILSTRQTQKINVPGGQNSVTCPHNKQILSKHITDNHGGKCVVSIEF